MSEPVLIPIYGTRDGVRGVIVAHAQVSPEDEALVSGHRWNLVGGYAQAPQPRRRCPETGRVLRSYLLMHRLIVPAGETIDHINRDRLDNRRENLRAVTRGNNTQNTPARSASGFKGVSATRGGWRAVVFLPGGQKRQLPTRDTPEEAALDYDWGTFHLRGPQARFNRPDRLDPARLDAAFLDPAMPSRRGRCRRTSKNNTEPLQ